MYGVVISVYVKKDTDSMVDEIEVEKEIKPIDFNDIGELKNIRIGLLKTLADLNKTQETIDHLRRELDAEERTLQKRMEETETQIRRVETLLPQLIAFLQTDGNS